MKTNVVSTASIRAGLLKDIHDLRRGVISVTDARCRASLARSILDTIKIEILAHELGITSSQPILLGVVENSNVTFEAAE